MAGNLKNARLFSSSKYFHKHLVKVLYYLEFNDINFTKLFQFKHVNSINEDDFLIVANKRFGLGYIIKQRTKHTNYISTSIHYSLPMIKIKSKIDCLQEYIYQNS